MTAVDPPVACPTVTAVEPAAVIPALPATGAGRRPPVGARRVRCAAVDRARGCVRRSPASATACRPTGWCCSAGRSPGWSRTPPSTAGGGSSGCSPSGCRSPRCCWSTTPAAGSPTGWACRCTSPSRPRSTGGWAAACCRPSGCSSTGTPTGGRRVAALVYGSHFVVTPLLLCVLWVRDRARWGRYVRLVLALSARRAASPTSSIRPRRRGWPPRTASSSRSDRLSGSGWEVLGLPHAGALLADSQGQVNPVAAVPSLHTAFAVLICLVLLPGRPARVAAGARWSAYAVLMPLVLVWSGEHYVVDTLLGAALRGAVWRRCVAGAARPRPCSPRGRGVPGRAAPPAVGRRRRPPRRRRSAAARSARDRIGSARRRRRCRPDRVTGARERAGHHARPGSRHARALDHPRLPRPGRAGLRRPGRHRRRADPAGALARRRDLPRGRPPRPGPRRPGSTSSASARASGWRSSATTPPGCWSCCSPCRRRAGSLVPINFRLSPEEVSLHRRPLRRPRAAGRPRAGVLAQGRRGRAPVRHGGGVRAAAALRRRAAAVGRARRGRHRHDQLHQRDDGAAQGRADDPPQHLGQRRHLRHAHAGQRPRRLPAHAADVPLQRLGAAVHDGRPRARGRWCCARSTAPRSSAGSSSTA